MSKKNRFPGTKKLQGTFISKGIMGIMGHNWITSSSGRISFIRLPMKAVFRSKAPGIRGYFF
jgi:hypothetical protein